MPAKRPGRPAALPSRLLEELAVRDALLDAQSAEFVAVRHELDAARQQLEDALDLGKVGYALLDTDGLIVWCNRFLGRMLSVKADRLQGRPLVRLVAANDMVAYHELLSRLKKGGGAPSTVLRLRAGRILLHVRVSAAVTSEGATHMAFIDVTAATAVNQTLHDAEMEISALHEATPDAILLTDGELVVTSVNRAALRIFETHAGELRGRPLASMVEVAGRIPGSLLKPTMARPEVLVEGVETTVVTPSGRRFAAEVTLTALPLGGRPVVLAVVRDLVARALLHRKVLEATEEVQRRIACDLHDGLNQQMVGISMLADAVAKRLAVEGHRDAPSVARMVHLLGDLVRTSRTLVRGMHVLELQGGGLSGALQALATQTEELTGVKTRFSRPALPVVVGDEISTQLYRIAQEAVNNAVRHGAAESIQIALSMDASALIVLTVVDDGCGLPADLTTPPGPLRRDRVKKTSPGSGLRIMAERARLMGAVLTVQPDVHGTRVQCVVPRSEQTS